MLIRYILFVDILAIPGQRVKAEKEKSEKLLLSRAHHNSQKQKSDKLANIQRAGAGVKK